MCVCLKINGSTHRSTKKPFLSTKNTACWRKQITDTQSTDTPPLPPRTVGSVTVTCPSTILHKKAKISSGKDLDCPLLMVSFSSVPKEKQFLFPLEERRLWKVDGDCYSHWIKWKSLEKLQEGVALSVPDMPCKKGTVLLLTCTQGTSWRRKKPKPFKVSNMYSCISPLPPIEISLCDSWNMSF